MICEKCQGCGLIANTEKGEPWSYWVHRLITNEEIPEGIYAIPCTECGGCRMTHCCEGDQA